MSPRSRWPSLAVACLGASFLLLGLRAILAASPTTDEPGHYRYGHRILRGIAERWDDSKMPVSALNALPCYAGELAGWDMRDADEFAGPCDWTAARIPTLLGGLALGLVIAAWSRRLFGPAAGALAFGLFAADPNLLAHSSLITTDVFGTLFLLVALRTFAWWLDSPTAARGLALGIAVGAASISKYSAAYLPVIFVLTALLRPLAATDRSRSPLRSFAASGGLALVAALVVINAGFLGDGTFTTLRDQKFENARFRELRKVPVLSEIPLPVPRPFVEGLDRVFHRERNGGGSGNIYLMGELRAPGSEGFKSYFAVTLLAKTPIPSILLIGVALGVWLISLRGRPVATDEIVLAATVLVFALYFTFIFRAQIGIRHFLVVIPPLLVLAGSLAPKLAASPARSAAAAFAILLSLISVVRHGDDPLSYFNEAIPPTKTYRIAADSNLDWGQSRARIDAYLAAHPETIVAPARPFPGRILVGANQLTGVVTRKRMEWLRESGLEPVGHVAFTHFLFDVTREQAEAWRARRNESPLPEEIDR